jgi:hypothetical protein
VPDANALAESIGDAKPVADTSRVTVAVSDRDPNPHPTPLTVAERLPVS